MSNTTGHLGAIDRWQQREDEELLYTPVGDEPEDDRPDHQPETSTDEPVKTTALVPTQKRPSDNA